ncbi:type II toxin-antitoxin system VapC family toxin [Spirosoma linguale]|uniref:Ribonuclease VapC n=1 Tax=Spirosoma linguale (strain ATCC 33905 / DSM 74 / LMG 10896 / Claus 1) TaxID=504472 RepID=D2QM76_SPILD|nr:PilT protein domain protein [Spirosoma linguale DSM 74]
MIVDTSVWIDAFRGGQSEQVRLVATYLAADRQIFITPTIVQEVLQGVRADDEYVLIKEGILAHSILRLDPVEAAIGAADLYRSLRKKGVTIRKPNDCLIAHYAIFYDIPVLHHDADFDQIASHTALRIAV